MANRIVTATVSGETIKLSNKVAGASGSFNAVSLLITFDETWDNTTKKVYFFDAYGENAVYRLLTTDLLSGSSYIVPIPAEPLAYAGEMTITIRGVDFETDGTTAERIIMSASTTMKVLSAIVPASDVSPVEPTPTQAEQLQAEIDDIKDTILNAEESATAAGVSKTAAELAETHAETAETNAKAAQAATELVVTGFDTHAAEKQTDFDNNAISKTNTFNDNATSKTTAFNDNAISKTNAFDLNAASANTTIDGKVTIATTAASDSQTAQGLSESARDDSISAKNDAQTAKTAAELAETHAKTSETNAQAAEGGAVEAREAIENMTASATGLAEGANPTVTKTTTDGVVNLAFGIPVGAKGETGSAGSTGAKGETGLTGTTGATGAKGADGADGYTPQKGIDYFDGAKGETGAAGATGAAGKPIEYTWNGTQLGVRVEGDTEYAYVDLKGAKGDTGAIGNGISSVVLHSGNHAAGTTDTYRITFTDSTIFDIAVYNGANGDSLVTSVNSKTGAVVLTGADVVLTGYTIASTVSDVTDTDTINVAFGKLAKTVSGIETLLAAI